MKIITILLITSLFALTAAGQHADSLEIKAKKNAEMIARKMANKMKDSLSLSETKTKKIYAINMDIYEQKADVRKNFAGNPEMGKKIQKIENTRDSLYRLELSDSIFVKYKNKKIRLINNN